MYVIEPITDEEYLAHYGILGMKWGRRRYQNADGSLTKAGKKRYGIGEGKEEKPKKLSRKEKKAAKARAAEEARIAKNNRIKAMSDEEIANEIRRMELEKQYVTRQMELNALLAGPKQQEKASFGKKFMDNAKDQAAKKLSDAAIDVGTKWLTKKANKMLGLNEGKTPYEKLKAQYDMEKLQRDIESLRKDNAKYDKLKAEYDYAKLEKDLKDLRKGSKEEIDKRIREMSDEDLNAAFVRSQKEEKVNNFYKKYKRK